MTRILRAEHPERGALFAAVDQDAHHVQGRVAQTRMGAFTSPYRTEEDALGALLAAGGVLCVDGNALARRRS